MCNSHTISPLFNNSNPLAILFQSRNSPQPVTMKSISVLALAALTSASPMARTDKGDDKHMDGPFQFTSTYNVIASPNQVVDSENQFTGGLEGCTGMFNFGINAHENVICYNITIDGFSGDYESPATSATHIHEAGFGMSGPPR